MNRHKLFIFIGIALSIILIIIASFIAANRTSWRGRAQNPSPSSLLSLDNSYVFASPISAAADGASLIRVTVFVLSSQGLGIAGQTVELQVSGPITVAKIQPVTDSFGRAIFDLTSSTPGNYTISAAVSSATLPQTVTVSFL